MSTIPTAEPEALAAGDTWQWTTTALEYPASAGWQLSYAFQGLERLVLAFAAEVLAVGDGFAITVPAATTAPLTPGTFRWQAYVTKAGERHLVRQGAMTVLPNYVAAPAGSLQTHAEKTLAVIEAALEGRLTSDIESYQIAGRAVSKIPIVELQKLRNRYWAEVDMQRHPGRFGINHVASFRG